MNTINRLESAPVSTKKGIRNAYGYSKIAFLCLAGLAGCKSDTRQEYEIKNGEIVHIFDQDDRLGSNRKDPVVLDSIQYESGHKPIFHEPGHRSRNDNYIDSNSVSILEDLDTSDITHMEYVRYQDAFVADSMKYPDVLTHEFGRTLDQMQVTNIDMEGKSVLEVLQNKSLGDGMILIYMNPDSMAHMGKYILGSNIILLSDDLRNQPKADLEERGCLQNSALDATK